MELFVVFKRFTHDDTNDYYTMFCDIFKERINAEKYIAEQLEIIKKDYSKKWNKPYENKNELQYIIEEKIVN